MRIAKVLVALVLALALASTAALAEGGSAPTVVSTTTSATGESVTTFSDGSKLVSPASFSSCPSGWVCIWENKEYSGRMLEFQERGFWQNLTVYGFNDQTSSWANKTNDDAKLAQDINGGGNQICLQPQSSNSQLTGFNDEASSIRIFTTSTVC